MQTEGVDFIGPDPSILTFTPGQSTGDVQCANVTILDNSILEGQRSFSVELGEVHSETSVKINETMTSVDIDIDDDPNDSEFASAIEHYQLMILITYSVPHQNSSLD